MVDSLLIDRVFENQRSLSVDLKAPQVSRLALFLLSRPISSTSRGEVLDFFGAFWSWSAKKGMSGFFATESEAHAFLDHESNPVEGTSF